jgi:hypothetical protein
MRGSREQLTDLVQSLANHGRGAFNVKGRGLTMSESETDGTKEIEQDEEREARRRFLRYAAYTAPALLVTMKSAKAQVFTAGGEL